MAERPRTISGRIAYRAADGREIGRERFELIAHAGGHVLRALCEMDAIALIRDVSIAMDADWLPLDGFCRVHQAGGVAATYWLEVHSDAVRVAAQVDGRSLPEQRIVTTGRLPYLGLHPLQGDALIARVRGTDRVGDFRPIAAVTNSISPNGDEALGVQPMTIDVAYLGLETITVAAGAFVARRYALRWRADWPPADLWVREQDCVFLCMRWPLIAEWYELESIDE
ncbi:hypothetical protein FHS96_004079 [Sphingomonas zeicaulis]|uniref:hypothetical protein n=1 Tax=Sphingomonas zeicaulis TaxID=1632740 RepID=UPI003D1C55FF